MLSVAVSLDDRPRDESAQQASERLLVTGEETRLLTADAARPDRALSGLLVVQQGSTGINWLARADGESWIVDSVLASQQRALNPS